MIAQRARLVDRPESVAGLLVDLTGPLAVILATWFVMAVLLP